MSIHMWLMVAVIGITAFYSYTNTGRTRKLHCIQCVTVILTCFSGFRSWKMGDVYHYCYAYQDCQREDWVLDWAGHDTIGLQLFYRVAGKLDISFEVCLFLIAAFSAITLGILIYRYSTSPLLSYVLYLGLGNYIFTLSGLKQTIAMGFITLAMIAILEVKPVKFLAFTLLAGVFHLPALVFLPAYIIARKKIDLVYVIFLGVVIYLIYNFRDDIVGELTDLYYEGELEFGASENLGGKFIVMVGILLMALIIRPVQNYDYAYRCLYNIILVATVIQSVSVYDNVFTRLADYYFQFFIIFIPMLLEPAYIQADEHPSHIRKIRFWPDTYYFIGKCVVVVGVCIFYTKILDASVLLLKDFHFFWEVDTPSPVDFMHLIGE